MAFLASAIPSLFSSPLVRNVLGGIASDVWGAIKKRGGEAISGVLEDTVGGSEDGIVKRRLKPYMTQRRKPDYYMEEEYPKRRRYQEEVNYSSELPFADDDDEIYEPQPRKRRRY